MIPSLDPQGVLRAVLVDVAELGEVLVARPGGPPLVLQRGRQAEPEGTAVRGEPARQRESVLEPTGPRTSAVPPAGKPRPRPDPDAGLEPQPQA